MTSPIAITDAAPASSPVLRSVAGDHALGPAFVARARLVRRLMGARDLPLVLLAAPAGYGKTTTLLDWAQHDERPFAWVALDGADDHPGHLATAVARTVRSVRRRGAPYVLVLDGLDELHTEDAMQTVADLVDHPPDGAQIALSSRCEPALALGRLRAHRAVLELSARDFVMTRGEAAALLRRAGVVLPVAEVDELVQRTEGWPTGLYLAALSLRETPDPAAAVSRFHGDDRAVTDYLTDTVLAELADDDLGFLLHTSVLDRLSGPLCDALLDAEGSAARLRGLARANVLLVALDRTDRWYRYHGLFARMLRTELRRREPALEPELHRRAGRWHAEQGDVDAALRHAAAAGDPKAAGELLWGSALGYLSDGRQDQVLRWLEPFGAEERMGCPPLALIAASAHLARGERELADYWVAAADHALEGMRGGRAKAYVAGVALARAAAAPAGVARMHEDAAHARGLGLDDGPWRCVGAYLEGTACQLLGDADGARALLREGARVGVVAAPAINALCLAQLALLALDRDDRREAAELAGRARANVERARLGDLPAMSIVHALSALTRAQLGQVEGATADAAVAGRLLARLGDSAPWYPAQARIALARTALALSDVAWARGLLEDAADAVEAIPDAPVLLAWLQQAEEAVDAYSTSATTVPASLTAAELRILRLLPTHLSFREMGGQLFISPNTVKTQAQAVYRKLDASSRSEAVERGRAIGLIES